MVSEPNELVNLMQVNFLQPVYNFTFSNGLIACIVFFGAMSDISFILLPPGQHCCRSVRRGGNLRRCWVLKYSACPPTKPRRLPLSAAQMGRWCSLPLILAPNLFAHRHYRLSLPEPDICRLSVRCVCWCRKILAWKLKLTTPTVSKKAKFIYLSCLLLCLLLPVAAPLILSFFLGIAIKEAEIEPFQKLLESTLTYTATLFLGLLLGTLCEAQTILDPKVAIILIMVSALAISAVGALLGGWVIWFISKGRYNPAIGIAGVLPADTAKSRRKG